MIYNILHSLTLMELIGMHVSAVLLFKFSFNDIPPC
jgi:hypothetical protein